MRSLAQWKFLVGTLMLLLFAFSANGLVFGSHGAAELAVALATMDAPEALAECTHDHSGHHGHSGSDHQPSDDDGHCCHPHHSHDLQDGPGLVLGVPLPAYRSEGVEPLQVLSEVYLDRFIPPQNLS